MNFQLKERIIVVFFNIFKNLKNCEYYAEHVAEGKWIMLAFRSVQRIDFLAENFAGNIRPGKIKENTMIPEAP